MVVVMVVVMVMAWLSSAAQPALPSPGNVDTMGQRFSGPQRPCRPI